MKIFARHPATHNLALRVHEVDQPFNSLDPTPFLNKDIDPEAENFIESWAAEFPAGSNFHITVHVEQWPSDNDPNKLVSAAIHNHFSYQAVRTRKSDDHRLGCDVAPIEDFSLRLVADPAADTPVRQTGQCAGQGDSGEVSASNQITLFDF